MLTNSPVGKLKASKSSRDLDELRDKESEGHLRLKIFEKAGEGDQDNSIYYSNSTRNSTLSSKIFTSRDRVDLKPKPRTRRDDYQMPHASSGDRRGSSLRSRGSGFARKVERENDSGGVSRGKFQESLIKGSHSDVTLPSFAPSSKYYNEFEGSKLRLDHASYNIPEDCRISKILRRLSREDDTEKFLSTCQQLQESLCTPDNSRYVRRAFDDIANSLLNTMHRAPGADARNMVARCLGRTGFVLIEHDFKRYTDWLFAQFEVERNDIRLMLLAAMKETLRLDKVAPNIKESAALMAGLQTALEATDIPEAIMASVDVIVMVTESYPAAFTKHFRDTVDILVGWHIDGSCQPKVVYYASRSLQKLGPYWAGDLGFTVTLLGQFLEDMESYGDDFNASPCDEEAEEKPLVKIAALIKVFNAVLLSLGPHLNQPHFLADCLTKVLNTTVKTLATAADQELAVAADQCVGLLLARLRTAPAHHDLLYRLVDMQMRSVNQFADETQAAMLELIATVVREVSGNLSLEFVQSLLATDSPLLEMRLSPSVAIQSRVLAIYLGLLNLKNITLLQEAYRHTLGSLEHAYRTLVPSCPALTHTNPYPAPVALDPAHAENTVLFHLRALAELANAANSIIGMWALNPSVLELLAVKMRPIGANAPSPAVTYAIVYLLHGHCDKSNNFVSSSRLVTAERSGLLQSESPTNGHLSVVLGLLAEMLSQPDLGEELALLALAWCRQLLAHAEPFFPALYPAPEMDKLISIVLGTGVSSTSPRITSLVHANMYQLLACLPSHKWRSDHLAAAVAACLRHCDSTDAPVRLQATVLATRLPLEAIAAGVRSDQGLHAMARVYVARNTAADMQGQHLRRLLGHLLQGSASPDLLSMLSSCRPREASALHRAALGSQRALAHWALWEAAQLCVALKLRTPLGKPHDTFTAVEAAIKALAREACDKTDDTKTCESVRVRRLLQFLDHLEKSLHVASEGCATATLPAPSAPVRAFFRTNAATCREWLARVRLAALAVADRAGHSASALRHGHCLLETLQGPSVELELAAVHMCSSLVKLGEPQAITGLHVWCRDVAGRKLSWLKAASLQAAGKLELAAEEYRRWIDRTASATDSTPEPQVAGFVSEQLCECYRRLQDWERLHEWKLRERALWGNENGGTPLKYVSSAVSADQAAAMRDFESGDVAAAAALMRWPEESSLPDVGHQWSSARLMSQAECALRSSALLVRASAQPAEWQRALEQCDSVPRCLLELGGQDSPAELLQEAVVLQYASAGLRRLIESGPECKPSLVDTAQLDTATSSLLGQALWWSECLGAADDGLRLQAVRAARKEGNAALASRLLIKHLDVDMKQDTEKWTLPDAARHVMSRDDAVWSPTHVKACSELAKLLHATESANTALDVCSYAAVGIAKHLGPDNEDHAAMSEASARLLLTLAKWLTDGTDAGYRPPLLPALLGQDQTDTGDDIGSVLKLSTWQCPALGKAWARYAAWSYRCGKRSVEASSGQLSDADRAVVAGLVDGDDLDQVLEILGRPRQYARDEEDIEGDEGTTCESVRAQLAAACSLSPTALDALVDVWRAAQHRAYGFYQQAAAAYFNYLAFTQQPGGESCEAVSATLRLLRLITKHATELQSALEQGLAATPTAPWMTIIPQLFARLSHPEAYVRRRVSELLCRVAQDAPHLITFPAVVGARLTAQQNTPSSSRLFITGLPDGEDEDDDDEDDDDDEGVDNEEDVSVLVNCFLAMVDTLSKQASLAISQVELVVTELHRITLLWDELWLGTLAQHHAEVTRRLGQLEAEVRRVDDNPSLSQVEKDALVAEKHRIIMKPLLFIFEQLHTMTSVPPETPHEVWFQEKFGSYIGESLSKLRTPADPRRPHDSWSSMRALHARLQQRATKRASHALRMSDVSPALAQLVNTEIAMPGVGPRRPGEIVTIAAVGPLVAVLPTKTKPKKLVFHGSDGQMYTYLFKGLEDLHLDERIMQFLGIANTMLARERGATYRARHYSVTPLGPRSGLIGWVDDVTPLFGLYKRWQQREQQAAKGSNAAGGNVAVLRPSELFYNKLTPLLKEKNVGNLDCRKEWPLPVLRQVLMELMQDTPKDLLAKELWCHATSAGGWWRATRTYSHSVAVMSIIGYIIGLGDRHLDNVLVDLDTGEVVHIDYNVCFEKGKTLRVPEKVPFRMTQNIRAALGVTGVEGIFRLTCEHVLRVMKKGRETLLTLLEAFVYDPLIDWTPGNEAGYTGAVYGGTESRAARRQLENEVARAMFAVRLVEMRADWAANREHLLRAAPELEAALEKWLEVKEAVKAAEEALQDCHQQMGAVKEAEAVGSAHPLYTLAARWQKHRRAREAVDGACAALQERLAEARKQALQHEQAALAVRGPRLGQWMQQVDYAARPDQHMVFDLVKEFLMNAGQGAVVAQCEVSEAELGTLEQQQVALLRAALDLLTQYKAVSGLYPCSYLATHRSTLYARWAARLLLGINRESISEVRGEYAALLNTDRSTGQHILAASFQQQNILTEANMRLQKWYERLSMEESILRADKAYADAHATMTGFPLTAPGAGLALECVNVTALCALNKRYIRMETAAFCSGDSLVELTSRDGDWFLDEMYMVSTSMSELAGLVALERHQGADDRVALALRCVQAAHGIYKGLQELNFNFHTIILAEAVERVQAEETTVMAMVASLEEAIAAAGAPLGELRDQLEKHLRCIIMEMESPHAAALGVVSTLRARFSALTAAGAGDDRPGLMLLMGFNGLFERLHEDGAALVQALDTLHTPACWRKIDQVRDARAISVRRWYRVQFAQLLAARGAGLRVLLLEDMAWLCSAQASLPVAYALHSLGNLVQVSLRMVADDHMLASLGRSCNLLEQLDVSGSSRVTDAGVRALCLASTSKPPSSAPPEPAWRRVARAACFNCFLDTALDADTQLPAWWRASVMKRARRNPCCAALRRVDVAATGVSERGLELLAAPVFNEATRNVLEDIFLVKRLATMSEFFALCRAGGTDDERLARPVRRYTADYVRRRLLGVTSQTLAIALCLLLQRVGLNVTVEVDQRDVGAESKVSLDELCRKAVDACLKRGAFTSQVLTEASAACSSLEASWRRKEAARRTAQEAEARRATLKRLHYQLTAFHWLHEDVLTAHGALANPMVLINRGSFMAELRTKCSALVALQPRITDAQAKQTALVTSVAQRLKWAAGANPALMEVLAAFESALTERNDRLAREQRLALEVAHTCSAIVHHEALRTRTTEALSNDASFMQLVDECEASAALGCVEQGVSAMEESLVHLLAPEAHIDHAWIHGVERIISGLVKALQQQITALGEGLDAAQDDIKSRVAELRALLNAHHKLMADVKGLIKHMIKHEDSESGGLAAFWSRYRSFSERLSGLARDLACEEGELDGAAVHAGLRQLRRLRDDAPAIFRDLMACDGGVRRRPPLVRQESVRGSPRRQTRDPHTGKAVQERNAYAVNVWRRVRTKLEGRDPDLGRRLSNQEQVDYVIREATSHDNLALLYEGWTPWV